MGETLPWTIFEVHRQGRHLCCESVQQQWHFLDTQPGFCGGPPCCTSCSFPVWYMSSGETCLAVSTQCWIICDCLYNPPAVKQHYAPFWVHHLHVFVWLLEEYFM